MRRIMTLAAVLAVALIWVDAAAAQGPKKKGKGPPPRVNVDDQEQRALDRLQLTGTDKTKAQRALDAHQTKADRELRKTRQEFLQQMKEALTADQYLQFKDSVDTGPGQGRPVTADDLVERVMVFDKNKTGKVAKEDLPERMQHLIALGDTNGDGCLDRAELVKLAMSKSARGPNQGRAFSTADAERALARLPLVEPAKTKAQAAVDAHKEATRKAGDQRRANLLQQMRETLSEEQFKRFTEGLPAS